MTDGNEFLGIALIASLLGLLVVPPLGVAGLVVTGVLWLAKRTLGAGSCLLIVVAAVAVVAVGAMALGVWSLGG